MVIHDGFLNTYTLHKNGRKITLVSLPPHQITKPKAVEPLKDEGVLLSFLNPTLKAEQSAFKTLNEMILYRSSLDNQIETPPHSLAKQLSQEYAHVFPEDIPHGLAPKRTIQHCIDLIPRAVLSNKLAYRMNPKDTIDI